MHRIAVSVCLVAALFAQGFALAGQMAAFARDGGATHSALHIVAVAHHHDHDGSIHKDGSTKSLKHLNADCCMQLAGLLPEGSPAMPAVALDRSRTDAGAHGHDSPFLEGLKRPPR